MIKKDDWEKAVHDLLTELVGIINRTRPGQVTHKIEYIKAFIRDLLRVERTKVLERLGSEGLRFEVEALLYGIANTYTDKLEELGKEQAQYAILGMGAGQIIEALIAKLKEANE